MNKSELVLAVAARSRVSKAEAVRVIDALFAPGGVIAGELRKGGKVQVTGFGNFETRTRIARKGRDPRTGKEIAITPSVAAVFRAGKGLKNAVSRKKG